MAIPGLATDHGEEPGNVFVSRALYCSNPPQCGIAAPSRATARRALWKARPATFAQPVKSQPGKSNVNRDALSFACPKHGAPPRWTLLMLFAHRIATAVAACAVLIFAVRAFAAAQGTANGAQSAVPGVKHVLYLSIKSDDPGLRTTDGASAQDIQASKETPKATLRVVVRLSDHSQETSFFGDVPASIANFDLAKGSPEQQIWQDERCHHERGFPRMLVMTVDGLIAHGSEKQAVEARRRHIGLPMPWDEILMASALQFSTDDRCRFIETGTQTKESHLVVDLKMYMLPCEVK
jgi:hypothetical protein